VPPGQRGDDAGNRITVAHQRLLVHGLRRTVCVPANTKTARGTMFRLIDQTSCVANRR